MNEKTGSEFIKRGTKLERVEGGGAFIKAPVFIKLE